MRTSLRNYFRVHRSGISRRYSLSPLIFIRSVPPWFLSTYRTLINYHLEQSKINKSFFLLLHNKKATSNNAFRTMNSLIFSSPSHLMVGRWIKVCRALILLFRIFFYFFRVVFYFPLKLAKFYLKANYYTSFSSF